MKKFKKALLKYKALIVMSLIPLALLIIFRFIPMYGIQIAFRDYKPLTSINSGKWMGFKYFQKFFGYYKPGELIKNTMILNLYDIALTPMPLLFALCVRYMPFKRLSKFVQNIAIIPHFLSIVILCSIVMRFLSVDGPINGIAMAMGRESKNLLAQGEYFYSIYVWSGVWQNMGYSAIIYSSALSDFPKVGRTIMSIKKLGCAILSAVVLLIAGCNASETDNNSENVSGINENVGILPNGEYPIVTDDSVELTVWAILSSEIEDYSTNKQSEWYEEYSGVKINWINIPRNGWADQFKLSVMSGEYPDIYLYDFDTTEVQACTELGAIIPLNNLIEEYCPNIKKYLDNDPELRASVTAPDGNIYTLFSKSYNSMAYKHKLWVNKDWFEMYKKDTGKDMPQTTDDFEGMLVYFKEHDMNGNGDPDDEIPFLGQDGLDGMYFLFNAFVTSNSSQGAFGCYLDNDQLKFAFNSDEYREALKYINGLHEKGLISDQTFTISQSDRFAYTSAVPDKIRAGVVSSVTADGIVQLSSNETLPDYSDYIAIPPIAGPNGHRTVVTDGEYTISLKNAITSSCKHPEIAARWLDYWFGKKDISDDSEWRSYTDELNKMGLQRYLELVELYVSNSN